MVVEVNAGKIDVRRGSSDQPDVVLSGVASQVLGLMLHHLDVAEARKRGLKVEGDLEVLKRVQP